MSKKQERIFWPVLLVVIGISGALAFVVARTKSKSERVAAASPATPATKRSSPVQGQVARNGKAPRNLSLQPEAFNLARRLGQRFAPGKREQSVLVGTLTIGADRRIVRLARKQTDQGEQVEINLTGSQGLLTWDADSGALSSGSRTTASERELIERLVLDSPDQFVLAQLRGASYYTVARNVRPVDAGDNYAGPLWNIVDVHDPEPDEAKRPQSRSRLYYLNVATGLIDRIESEIQGQRISAEIIWTEVNGEKVPGQITWIRQGQALMQYSLSNFSRVAQEEAR